MWNEIFEVMNLNYVENESSFEHFKKLAKRSLLVMFWGPFYLVCKLLKRLGLNNFTCKR